MHCAPSKIRKRLSANAQSSRVCAIGYILERRLPSRARSNKKMKFSFTLPFHLVPRSISQRRIGSQSSSGPVIAKRLHAIARNGVYYREKRRGSQRLPRVSRIKSRNGDFRRLHSLGLHLQDAQVGHYFGSNRRSCLQIRYL